MYNPLEEQRRRISSGFNTLRMGQPTTSIKVPPHMMSINPYTPNRELDNYYNHCKKNGKIKIKPIRGLY